MNIELTTKNLHKLCRICLSEGKLNLWQHKLKFEDDEEIALHKVFRIFDGEISNLNLGSEMPLLCEQCLEELLQCHRFYKKLEMGNKQMRKLYAEALQIEADLSTEVQMDLMAEDDNELGETEDFVEENYFEEQHRDKEPEKSQINNTFEPLIFTMAKTRQSSSTSEKTIENVTTANILPIRKIKAFSRDNATEYVSKRQRNHTVHNVPKDAQLVVTKFISTAARLDMDENVNATTFQQNSELRRTMDYAAIEVSANNLDEVIGDDDDDINSPILPSNYSSVTDDGSQPIYMCKYCPQAFSIPQYLIAHVRKSHVCKFCTKAFSKTNELHDHLKQEHKQHRCAICGKELSSHSNLRAHIKRLHGLQLPAQVALLDYRPSDAAQNQLNEELADDKYI